MTFGIADVRIPILEVSPKDIKPLFYALGHQFCYECSVFKSGKIFATPLASLTCFYRGSS